MKKLISVLLTVCIALSVLSVGFVFASAEGTLIKGTEIEWSYDSETKVLFFEGEGAIPDYNDFETVSGVTSVKYPWKGLEYSAIVFGEGITGIGNYAFCYSEYLERVTLPTNIAVLGKGIFLNCKALESVIIKAKSGTVGDNMFAGCDKLSTVEFMSGVKSIDYRAFYNCAALKELIVPDGVASIGEDAFYQCTSLKNVELSDSVKSIGKHAFFSCESLETLDLGNGLQTIGANAFDGCRKLKTVEIPESTTLVSSAAFSGCQTLESVVFPENLKEIQTNAFNLCAVLKGVTISAKTETIGVKAFGYGKYGYKIDGFTVTGYDNSAAEKYAKDNEFTFVSLGDYYSGKCGENIEWTFDKATGTLTLTGEGALADFSADNLPVYVKRFAGEVKKLRLDEKISAIGDYAFYNVTPSAITIPEAVEAIGDSAFGDAKPVISAYYKSAAHKYAVDNGLDFINLSPNGQIGEKVFWLYDREEEAIIISGEGETYSTYAEDSLPVKADGKVSKIEVGEDVTALYDNILVFDEPFETITFGSKLEKLGEKAFGFIKTEKLVETETTETEETENTEAETAEPVYETVYVPFEKLTVYGYRSTPVKAYAEKNGFEFIDLEPAPAEFPELIAGEEYACSVDEENKVIVLCNLEVNSADFIEKLDLDSAVTVSASTDVIGTDTILTLELGKEKKEYKFIVMGDLNGDGKVNSSDALEILQHSVGSKAIEGNALTAADLTGDGNINSADALSVLQVAVGQCQLSDFLKKEIPEETPDVPAEQEENTEIPE